MIPYQRFKITPRLGDIFHYRIFEIQKNIFVSGHREVICKKLISSYGLDIFFILIYSVGILRYTSAHTDINCLKT